jgi:hypothetical protein
MLDELLHQDPDWKRPAASHYGRMSLAGLPRTWHPRINLNKAFFHQWSGLALYYSSKRQIQTYGIPYTTLSKLIYSLTSTLRLRASREEADGVDSDQVEPEFFGLVGFFI